MLVYFFWTLLQIIEYIFEIKILWTRALKVWKYQHSPVSYPNWLFGTEGPVSTSNSLREKK